MHDFLKEGYFIKMAKVEDAVEQFYFISRASPQKYVYRWQSTSGADAPIDPGIEDGQYNITDLKTNNMNYLLEVVFGIKGPAYIYLNLPLETRRFGTDQVPISSSSKRRVGYLTQEDSPWEDPSSVTVHYLMKGGSFEYPALTAYNPHNKAIVPEIKFLIMACLLEQVSEPDVLDKLSRKLIPYRPIRFGGLPKVRSGPK